MHDTRALSRVRTACTYDCPDACGLVAEVGGEAGERPRLRGDPDHPITRGFLCQRIRRHLGRLSHRERLAAPRVREGERWREIGWDAALDLAAGRLRDALDRDGPASVVYLTGGGSLGLSKALIEHFFNSLGPVTSPRGGACGEAGEAAQRLDFGDAACHDYTDLEHSAAVVLWGKNPAATGVHLVPFLVAARGRGAPVVLVEARPSESAGLADRVIRVAPSGDGFLALAVLRRLLDRGALDPAGVARAEGFAAFERWLSSPSMTVERSVARAGASADAVDALAELYGGPGPVATWVGWGLQRRASGGRNLRCIDALGLLSGQVGRPGGGVNFTSTRRRGLDLAGLAAPRGRGIDVAHFGHRLAALDDPPPRFLYVAAANPVTQLPESRATREAMRRVGFAVVADAFFTDTAAAADLVLPVALMLEEDDVVGSYQHHHVAVARAIASPPAGARPDPWILAELGRRIGRPDDPVLRDPAAALARMTAPWFAGREPGVCRNPAQAPVPFADGFPTPTGKARLILAEPATVPELSGYPLVLMTPSCRRWQTSQRLEADQAGRLAECAVNPAAAAGLALAEGARARLESPAGGLEVVLRLDPRLRADECVLRRGGWVRHGQGVNVLVECRETDLGGGTAFYDQRVRLVASESTGPRAPDTLAGCL
jgi:anaerobic selenocysteine-containing dehydrogenase